MMVSGAARVAPEKAVFRPALPMSFLPGITEVHMATKRKGISKKTRFEVFKRDSFKCQYCGASAPEAILEVDHINPVAHGGENELINYITSCKPCNAGKSDRRLSDNSILAKQKAQLDELNERREQLEMMLQWRQGMKDIHESAADAAEAVWREHNPNYHLKNESKKKLTKLVKEFGLAIVLESIETAADQYHKRDDGGQLTRESVEQAWLKVGGIARMKALPESERQIHYIKGILRSRLAYVPFDIVKTIARAIAAGVDVNDIKQEAKVCRNWTQFRDWLLRSEEDASGQS